MNILSRIISIAISFGLLFFIVNLLKKKKLKERYALLWLLSGIGIFIVSLFHHLLYWISHALGIMMPINTVFFLGIIFILVINIHFSVVISNFSEQNKIIAQKLALLEAELENIKN